MLSLSPPAAPATTAAGRRLFLSQPPLHAQSPGRPINSPSPLLSPPRHRRLHVRCTDSVVVVKVNGAHETRNTTLFQNSFDAGGPLKIAVLGFGNFGQFLAKTIAGQGHTVLAHSRSDYSSVARDMHVAFFRDPHDLCEQHPDVILLCTSIISTESVLRSLPLQRLRRNTLFVDVLSVKEFPKNLFLQVLPPDFDILCTHPMFGPESGKNGWAGLTFVYDKVRIGDEDSRRTRCERFLEIFGREGCRMVEMTCAKHDRYAAGSQFITHTVGRMLEKVMLEKTPINTKGYETLMELVENTSSDSFDLYYGLFMYNKNAMEQLERLDLAFEALKKEMFGHLHAIIRKQLFGKAELPLVDDFRPALLSKLPKLIRHGNGNGLPASPPPSESEVTAIRSHLSRSTSPSELVNAHNN